jgi:recombination protein RecA
MAALATLEHLAQRHSRLRLLREQTAVLDPAALPVRWSFAALAGRLVELSSTEGTVTLSAAVGLVADAQRAGDLAVWVGTPGSHFYPPDAATHGVDLAQLAVVHVPNAQDVPLAGARLGRAGTFGLIVLDLEGVARVIDAHLGRLAQQAQRHEALVLCLTRKAAHTPSLGSLVSMRAEVRRERTGPGRFRCVVTVLKDKRHGAGWTHEETRRGVPGLH